MLEDRKTIREIAETIGISYDRIKKILHVHLNMKKITAKWLPRFLTVDQKQKTKEVFEQDFWRRFLIVDESWIHYYIPESKQQSKQHWLIG